MLLSLSDCDTILRYTSSTSSITVDALAAVKGAGTAEQQVERAEQSPGRVWCGEALSGAMPGLRHGYSTVQH
jgi:hypothetical protein